MRRLITIAAGTLLGSAAGAVPPENGGTPASGCDLQIAASPGSVWLINGYDPFSGSPARATYSLTFRNRGTAECRFVPVFSLEGGDPFGLSAGAGSRLNYSVRDITRGLDATPLTGKSRQNSQLNPVRVEAGGQASLNYEFNVDVDDIRGDGEYSQTVRLEAQKDSLETVGGLNVRLGIRVVPSSRIGLAGAYTVSNSGYAVVDLGELREGNVPVPLRLLVESTRNFKLTFESRNAGNLALSGTEWRIPYKLRIGNDTVELGGGPADMTGSIGVGGLHTTLPVNFRVGDVSARRAGVYSDVISISVAPN